MGRILVGFRRICWPTLITAIHDPGLGIDGLEPGGGGEQRMSGRGGGHLGCPPPTAHDK